MRRCAILTTTLMTTAVLGLAGCGNTTEERAATGALAGGTIGAVTEGGLVGTGVGAAAGAATGAVASEVLDKDDEAGEEDGVLE